MRSPVHLPVLALLLLCCCASCKRQETRSALPEEKFVAAYTRLTAATVTVRPLRPDSLSSIRMVDSLLALEGVTREEFEATVRWYNQDVERWKPFYDAVVRALEDSVRQHNKSDI